MQVAELKLQGIRCTNCAQKIKIQLPTLNEVQSVSVNVLEEKAFVEFQGNQTQLMSQIEEKLKEISIQVVSQPVIHKKFDQKSETRNVSYLVESYQEIDQIRKQIENTLGIINLVQRQFQSDNSYQPKLIKVPQILELTYNFKYFKAKKFKEILDKLSIPNECYNYHIQNFRIKNETSSAMSRKQLNYAIGFSVSISFMTMVIPFFDKLKWLLTSPSIGQVISLYLIILVVVSFLAIKKFGFPAYQGAYQSYRDHKLLNMQSLITLGSLSALGMFFFHFINYLLYVNQSADQEIQMEMSGGNMHGHGSQDGKQMRIMEMAHSLESASLILCVVAFGKYLEGKAKNSIFTMTKSIFPQDQLLTNLELQYVEPKNRNFVIQSEQMVDIGLLDKNDLIRVKGPLRLLLDAVVLNLQENQPLQVVDTVCYGSDQVIQLKKGAQIKSGALIKEGTGIVQIENTLQNSMLMQVSKQLNMSQIQSQSEQSWLSSLNSQLAEKFVLFIILLALGTLVVWYLLIVSEHVEIHQNCVWCFPIERAVSILVASCPCALGLAIPSVLVIILNIAIKNGLLIQKNRVIQTISRVKGVVFDQTGTLFTQVDSITDQEVLNFDQTGLGQSELWQIVSLLQRGNVHPLGELLFQESLNRIKTTSFNVSYSLIQGPQLSSNGLTALINRKSDSKEFLVQIGNSKMIEYQQNNKIFLEKMSELKRNGQTVIVLVVNQLPCLMIVIENKTNLRPQSQSVVKYLREKLGKQVFILSGDAKETVVQIGDYLGVPDDNLFGETDQEGKKKILQSLREERNIQTMMVGDGLNDVLSLEEALVGVSINAKSQLNLMVADVVALNENLWKIPILFQILSVARFFILCNLLWAFLYNLMIIPVSAGVFYSINFFISPSISSIAMSFSSIFVVIFSNLLKCVNYQPQEYTQSSSLDRSNQYQIDSESNQALDEDQQILGNQKDAVPKQKDYFNLEIGSEN